MAVKKGYQAVAFGPRIFRTETAAVSVIVSAQLLWGDLAATQSYPLLSLREQQV